jgi:hypothetical protein
VNCCPAYAAKEVGSGYLALAVEVATSNIPADMDFPSGLGFELTTTPITHGRFGKTRVVLSERGNPDKTVFTAVAENLLTELSRSIDERDAVTRLVQRLHHWQTFMKNRGLEGMSRNEQLGLYGELIVLREFVLANTSAPIAITAWKGYERAAHDFQLTNGSLEVKTTGSDSPHSFHVSNLTQLDSSQDNPLYLSYVETEVSSGGDQSLPELVESIRINLDPGSAIKFDEGLIEAGYIDIHTEKYQENKYSLRRIRFFEISEDFPKIRHSVIPDGVENVRYEVALATCSKFSKTIDEMRSTLFGSTAN